MPGRAEIGFTYGQADDNAPLRLKLCCLCGHPDGRGGWIAWSRSDCQNVEVLLGQVNPSRRAGFVRSRSWQSLLRGYGRSRAACSSTRPSRAGLRSNSRCHERLAIPNFSLKYLTGWRSVRLTSQLLAAPDAYVRPRLAIRCSRCRARLET